MTHYQTLELPADAPAAAIRQAYRRLVLLTHPDRTPDPAAHARYLAVNAAYEVLTDPARKAAYDASFQAPVPPPARPFSPGRARDEARRRMPRQPPRAPVPNTVRYAQEYARVLRLARPWVILALLITASFGADYLLATNHAEQVTDYEHDVYYTGGGRYSRGTAHRYYRHFTALGSFETTDQIANGTRVVVRRTPLWHRAVAVYRYPAQQPIEAQDYTLAFALAALLAAAAGFYFRPTFNADHRLMAVMVTVSSFALLLLLL